MVVFILESSFPFFLRFVGLVSRNTCIQRCVRFRNLRINNKSPDLRGKGPEVQLAVFSSSCLFIYLFIYFFLLLFLFHSRVKERKKKSE